MNVGSYLTFIVPVPTQCVLCVLENPTCIQDSGEICITVKVAPIWVQNLLIFINMPNKTNKSSQIPIFGILSSSRRTCGQDLSFTSWQLTLVGSWRLPGGYV